MSQEVAFSQGVQVEKICQTDIVCCAPEARLDEALQLMAARAIGSVLVCEGQVPVGILSRAEAMSSCLSSAYPHASPCLREVMSPRLLLVSASTSIDEVGVEMLRQRQRHAVVVDAEGRLVGIVSERDIVNHQGLEHDLFLRSVADIAPKISLRIDAGVSMRDIIDRLRSTGNSAALVLHDGRHAILTETDVIRFLAGGADIDRPAAQFVLSELMAVDGGMSLFTARKIFRRHGFRHLGVRDADGQVTRLLSYSDILHSVERDYVTRLKEMLDHRSEALQRSMHNLHLIEKVINASMEGVIITDTDGLIQSVNPAFTAITGYPAQEVIGRNPSLLSSGRHDRQFYVQMWARLKRDGQWQGEIWNRTKAGTVYPEWLSITAINDDDGEVARYAAIFHDLTEVKRSEARIRQMAHFDDVTCLANRKLFNDRLALAIHYAREQRSRCAVLALDLDMFKRINDRFGHACGDEVLRTLAQRIEESLGSTDTAARPGGDEFLVILNDIDAEQLNRRLEHLARVISTPVLIDATEMRITASVGVAIYPDDVGDGEGLVQAAETALHQAKEEGRNAFSFFSPELHQQRQSRYLMTAHLHHALGNGEFQLYYQPKIALENGQVVGVEALLRWFSAELGSVSPERFIPVAEDTGMIDEIGAWVMQEAARQARRWLDQGLVLPIAVNLSARQFQHIDVARFVSTALERYRLPASALNIELTETSFLHSAEKTAEALMQLHSLGVDVAIDDFGTGYSSLSYIRTMSLDQLKIDRSFVNNITDSDRDRQLVSAIIAMSQALGLSVVAEGVETEAQLQVLRELGCDQAQGYLFCRPLPTDELVLWHRQWQLRISSEAWEKVAN